MMYDQLLVSGYNPNGFTLHETAVSSLKLVSAIKFLIADTSFKLNFQFIKFLLFHQVIDLQKL